VKSAIFSAGQSCPTLFKEIIMKTKHTYTAVIFLATASALLLPLAHAGNSATYDAYEELSGTHANAKLFTLDGVRGREGMAGEAGVAGKNNSFVIEMNQAYEELSGTHASKPTPQSGAQGRSGTAGESGAAGKAPSSSPLFNILGDVADGCSKYLRCSGY
jgi:hypothetical protein